MENTLIILSSIIIFLLIINLILSIINSSKKFTLAINKFKIDVEDKFKTFENNFREEFRINREELAIGSKESRELITGNLTYFGQSQSTLLGTFQKQLTDLNESTFKRFNEFKESNTHSLLEVKNAIYQKIDVMEKDSKNSLEKIRQTVDDKLHQELDKKLGKQFEVSNKQLENFGNAQSQLLGAFQKQLSDLTESNIQRFSELKSSIHKSMGEVKQDVNNRLEAIRNDSNKQLDKMRATVDEKLHKTLEDRLGKSFELVSKQLEAVQKGLGEMQTLAIGVGDLKKVLGNVRTRGTLGEIQLISIIEQIMSPEQYSLNVATIPNSRNNVEIAIKLPGKDNNDKSIWLPIDSKFPMDKYSQFQDAIVDYN